jgi:hypothetical protein
LKNDIRDGADLLARPRRGVAPALVDELAEARRSLGRLEVGELEVGVVDRELGEDRFVVAQRFGSRAVLVPEPADEVGDLETDRRRPVRLVLHGLSHDPGGLPERQARGVAVRAAGAVAVDGRLGPRTSGDGRHVAEERELEGLRSLSILVR